MNLPDDWKAVLLALIGLLAAGLAIRFSIRKRKNTSNTNRSSQKGNTIGGDQAGRDINKG